MSLLSQQEIERRVADSDWTREGDAIVREWKLGDFAEAIAFVNRVAASPSGPTIIPTYSCTATTTCA